MVLLCRGCNFKTTARPLDLPATHSPANTSESAPAPSSCRCSTGCGGGACRRSVHTRVSKGAFRQRVCALSNRPGTIGRNSPPGKWSLKTCCDTLPQILRAGAGASAPCSPFSLHPQVPPSMQLAYFPLVVREQALSQPSVRACAATAAVREQALPRPSVRACAGTAATASPGFQPRTRTSSRRRV